MQNVGTVDPSKVRDLLIKVYGYRPCEADAFMAAKGLDLLRFVGV